MSVKGNVSALAMEGNYGVTSVAWTRMMLKRHLQLFLASYR